MPQNSPVLVEAQSPEKSLLLREGMENLADGQREIGLRVVDSTPPRLSVIQGHNLDSLRKLPDCEFQTIVTSPPYFGLRSYLKNGHPLKHLEFGSEKTPEDYVAKLVELFREARRTLKDDGTLWLNLGDSYASAAGGYDQTGSRGVSAQISAETQSAVVCHKKRKPPTGLKPKDLIGIPWKVAFALQADGWWLRSDIIWAKPNPMPESVTDRPTRAHEYIFLLSKSARYYYDAAAIREPASPALVKQIEDGYNGEALKDYLSSSVQDASATKSRIINGYRKRIDKQRGHGRRHAGFNDQWDALTPTEQALLGSNKRSVWTIAPANFREAHFATFPPALVKPCIMAGCPAGGHVLDVFGGSGTVGEVSLELGRRATILELNPEYIEMIKCRTNVTPGLNLA